MLTPIEKLNHEIDLLEKESQALKNKHVWGMFENWRAFVKLDIKIIDLKKEVLELEKQVLKQALIDYENY